MPDLLAARSQMGVSLAFHIIFAVVGIAMPVMMVVAERRWQVTGHAIYLDLAKRWAKGTAILFAVGAVSGTVLSFELGLLWPEFMRFAGPIIGMPFSLEGFAFFTEAIFLGIYLYGWDRIPPRAPPAGQARRGGGAVRDPGGRAAHARRLAGRGSARDEIRDPIALRSLAPRLPRPRSGGEGARRSAARRVAQRPGCALHIPAHGGARHVPGAGRAVGRVACLARCRSGPRSVAAARDRPRHADGADRGRGRLDGDGAGPAAVGDLWSAQDGRRRDADAGPDRTVPHVHAALLLFGRDRRVALVPADRS